jgi:HJR/Mrr/RecB family endonuclease
MFERFSKSYFKKLPTGVFVTKHEDDFVSFIYKLPWKLRQSNIEISGEGGVVSSNFLKFKNIPENNFKRTVIDMPNFAWHFKLSIKKNDLQYNIKYGLVFDPFNSDDLEIIKKILSNQTYYLFFDKNSLPINAFGREKEFQHHKILNISNYPIELRKLDIVLTYLQLCTDDTIIYYHKDWEKVKDKYRIDDKLNIEYISTNDDIKKICNYICQTIPDQIKDWDKSKAISSIKYFLNKYKSIEPLGEDFVLYYFTQFFNLFLKYLNEGIQTEFQIAFKKLFDEFIKNIKVPNLKGFFIYAKNYMFFEGKDAEKEPNKGFSYYYNDYIVFTIWRITYLGLRNTTSFPDHYLYFDDAGIPYNYKIPFYKFKSLKKFHRYLEGLSRQIYYMMGIKGFNELISENDDFSISDIYNELPLIENDIDLSKNLMKSAIKFREYFVTEPSEVLIDNKIFKSISIIDTDKRYACFKILTSDNKVSFLAISKLNHGVLWGFYRIFSDDHLFTLAALSSSIFRDFSVSETRLYERKKRITRKKAGKQRQLSAKKIIYLPRFKTKYLDDSPIIKEVGEKLERVIERREHDVSAHLRKIRHLASQIQLALAHDYGIEVPPGFTFVRPHHRSGIKRETIYKSRSALGLLIEASRKSLTEVQEILQETKEVHSEEISAAHEEAKNWKKILNNYEEFELFVKDLINKMGIDATETKKSHDGAIDIIARDNRGFAELKYIFQCKFYDPKYPVGVEKTRELFGVKSADSSIDKAILVTSNTFSSGAIKFAESNGIALIDGKRLFEMVSGLESKSTI